jgi:hypothetical protein
MVEMYSETGDPLIAPSSVSYNSLIIAWSMSNDPDAPKMADNVLMQMVDAYRGGNENVKPDPVSFSTVLLAYAKSNVRSTSTLRRCEELFEMMEEVGVIRNCYTYSALQNVYARSGQPDAPERAKAILDYMFELYHAGDLCAKPNTINYNDVITAYSRKPSRESAVLASEMLSMMQTPVEEGGYDVNPNKLSYAIAILACARCPDEVFAAQSAEANLEKLEARARIEALKRKEISSAAPPAVTLDIECFNVVLTAISKCRQYDAPERAIKIIERMERYVIDGHESLRPNLRSWNAVLNTFARAAGRKDRDFAWEAERILERMFSQHKDGDRAVQPDAFTFAAVLNAHQRCSDPSAIHRADAIVRKMEELYESGASQTPPDVFHYTILTSAWAKSGSKFAADRCLQILVHMYERDRAGYADVKPNVRTYNAVLDCLSRSNQEDPTEQLLYHMLSRYRRGDKDARPDAFSFNCVLHAFTKSKKKGSGRRAEAILDRFLEFEEDNPSVKPDTRSFTHIISYYSRSKEMDAPYRAEYVLNRLVSLYKSGHENLEPNLFAITTVMDSYTYAGHPDAGNNAERLLKLIRNLRDEYSSPKMKVSTAVMNSVLLAWVNSGAENSGYRADLHLAEMEASYRNGDNALQPDTRSYGLALSAWSKSNSPEKARRALELLRHMEQQQSEGNNQVHVDEHAYSLVINTCAFCNAAVDVEIDAFDIAVSLFDEMLESSGRQPSSLTYGWFIQACGRLHVDESRRAAAIEKAFTRCCEAGLLSDFVLHRLKGAAADELFWDLIGPWLSTNTSWERKKQKVSLDQLPKAWTSSSKLDT